MDTNKSLKDMAAMTPRRSSRLLHTHTPKLSDRKKGLFQSVVDPPRESLTTHRKLPVVDSDSDSEDCDLGIISTLDSSSDENDHNTPRTPDRTLWHETRNQTRKFLKENHDLKNFIKSPFTLKKYQNRYPYPETRCTGSVSTPVTPHLHNPPGTPSSTHSCASAHTTSSTSSRARKSLASLIADTESCSSSLKDLNFDTDSGTDSKENTPTKFLRQSNRTLKLTPKFHSFKGILREQKKNVSPITGDRTAVVSLTKMDMSSMISPTQMQKTPQNTTEVDSPPRISHRRSAIEIAESPESACDSEKSHKRLRNESVTENEPISKYARLENAPKARLSLFNSDRLKEILSTKSFYGKPNPVLNPSVTAKISNAIEVSTNHHRKSFHSQTSRRKRRPGQINLGVRHKIRKPKHTKNNIIVKYNTGKASSSTANNSAAHSSMLNSSVTSATNDASMISQNSSQELGNDKHDLFDKEKQTIEALLSQWEEEDIPEAELTYSKAKEIPCFSSSVIEETHQIFQPVTAVQVTSAPMPQDNGAVIVELGGEMTSLPQNVTDGLQDVLMTDALDSHEANHGSAKTAQFLPVEG
ncbi:putative Establishment of cohesion 1-like protein 2, partial [Operophtera brumata]